jgi:hypothetical protein
MIFRYIPHVLASLGFVSLSNAELCVDSPLNVIQGGGVYGCGDITDLSSCERPGVKSHCPATCDACDEYECVDSDRGFVYDGTDTKCSRLTSVSEEDLEMYCSYLDVSSTCRGTCNFCTTPTPAPTMINNDVVYGDVLRLVNKYNPSEGYLKSYGVFSGIDNTEGYGVYTTQSLGLYDGVGEWELVKLLPDGTEETGQLARYGDVVRLLNIYDPTKPYLKTYGGRPGFEDGDGYGVYTTQAAGLYDRVGDWELVKLLPDGRVVTGDVVQVGDVMRIRNLYDTNPNSYLMTYGDFSGIRDTEGYGVYTALTAMLVDNVGDWMFEYFD